MSALVRPFSPAAATVNIDVSGSNQRVQVAIRDGAQSVRVMNNGSATVWLAWGDVTATATTTTGLPVGPGVTEVLTLSPGQNGTLYIAAIAAGATGRIYFTPGHGV